MKKAFLALFAVIAGTIGCGGIMTQPFDPSFLINTGIGSEGTKDPTYILLSGPTCPTGSCQTYITVSDDFPSPYRMANTVTSKWIEPVGANNNAHAVGQYVFRLTFSLEGVDLNTVLINGQWASDNQGQDILINGISTGNKSPSLDQFSSFTISSGFHSGVNTLDFVVDNEDNPGYNHLNPVGLIVEFSKKE